MVISKASMEFTGDKQRPSKREYARLLAADGLDTRERVVYQMTITPDAKPTVEIVSPKSGTFRSRLSRVSLDVTAKDDYSIGKSRIQYTIYRDQVGRDGEVTEKTVKTGELPLSFTGDHSGAEGHITRLVSDLGAKDADRIEFKAMVADNCPAHAVPGESESVSVYVVTPERLRGVIGQDQKRVLNLVGKLINEEQRQADAIRKRLQKM